MLYTVRFLNGKPVCCGDISLPDDVTRAGLESAGNICMESDTEPEFYTRWVHTTPESPDNVAPKDADVRGIAIYLTDAEYDTVLASSVRQKRNRLIATTDYLVMPDYPISYEYQDKIKVYRQQLRDITEQEDFPKNVVFPDLPEKI